MRSSDTDVLILLLGVMGQQHLEVRAATSVCMDCGMGNSRKCINVFSIADTLEKSKPGLLRGLPGFHAFTIPDYTSAFYR